MKPKERSECTGLAHRVPWLSAAAWKAFECPGTSSVPVQTHLCPPGWHLVTGLLLNQQLRWTFHSPVTPGRSPSKDKGSGDTATVSPSLRPPGPYEGLATLGDKAGKTFPSGRWCSHGTVHLGRRWVDSLLFKIFLKDLKGQKPSWPELVLD